jgi:hypothetical protein
MAAQVRYMLPRAPLSIDMAGDGKGAYMYNPIAYDLSTSISYIHIYTTAYPQFPKYHFTAFSYPLQKIL